MHFGIRANLAQVLQQLLQVLLVGMTIGMMRNVVPALAESEFGVPRGSFMLLVAFVGDVVAAHVCFSVTLDKTGRIEARLVSHGIDASDPRDPSGTPSRYLPVSSPEASGLQVVRPKPISS